MSFFELFDAAPVLARFIAVIPTIIVPALMVLAACLCVFAGADGAVDAGSGDGAQ